MTLGELEDGQAVRVTDYWGEPTATPEWRQAMTDRLDMPGDGIWPDAERLGHYEGAGLGSTRSSTMGGPTGNLINRLL